MHSQLLNGLAYREVIESAQPVNLVNKCEEIAAEKGSWFGLFDDDDKENMACGALGKSKAVSFLNDAVKVSMSSLKSDYEYRVNGGQAVDLFPFKSDSRDITKSQLPETRTDMTYHIMSLKNTAPYVLSSSEGIEIELDTIFDSALISVVESVQPKNTIDNPLVSTFKLNPFFYTSQLGEELMSSGLQVTAYGVGVSTVVGLMSEFKFVGPALAYAWNYLDGIVMTTASMMIVQGAMMKFGTAYLLMFALFMMAARWLLRAVVGVIVANWVVIALMMPRRRYAWSEN